MLEDLIALQRSGRLGEAEAGYRQWLAAHPDDAEALHLLGILRAQRGDVHEGLELVTRASELAPERATCWYTLGEMQLSQGRLGDAARAYDQARGANPNLSAAHAGLGRVALRRGDVAAAETHFKVALRADENDVQALGGLGTVAGARGDASGALKWFTEATRLAPDDAEVQIGYAHAMLDLGLLDFAGQALDKALGLNPDEPRALALRAEVHVQKREVAEALPILEGLIARGEQLGPAHTALGDIARLRGRDDEAIAHYDEALRADPRLHQAAIRRAESLARGGRVAQAIDGLRAHVAAQPDDVTARIELASLLARAGLHDDAFAVWREAEARWPDDVDIKALHALALDRDGRNDAAFAKADLAAASPRPALAMLRARAALLAGDPAAAVQRLQRIDARQFEGKPPRLARRFQRLLGRAFDRLEQWPDAVDAFVRAQRPADQPLPELPRLGAAAAVALQRLAEGPGLGEARGPGPLLLCGLPGSGVGEVAALLSDQPGWFVRRDRFDAAPDFISAPFGPRLAQLDPTALALLARRYGRALERAGMPDGSRIVDWVPVLDARVVPALRRALPGTRLLIVAREPRDALLDWLAFGGTGGLAMHDPVTGARWQRIAAGHLDAAADMLPSLWVDPDVPLATGDSDARMRLRAFLGGIDLEPGPNWREASNGPGGLPARFPPGHAIHYHEALAEAFAALVGEGP